MKILIINYRYFVSGGPERYLFNLKSLLEEKGHQVIPFSVRYKQNLPSEYDKYFVEPITTEDEVYFREHTWSIRTIVKGLQRSFYSNLVYSSLDKLVKDTQPDFAIVLHYLRKLSPAVLTALNDNRIPFVVRLSDFGMICPNAHLIRDNQICELCIKGSLLNSVRYKCVQNSLAASAVNFLATKYHEFKRYFDLIPYFIVPSKFTRWKMVEAGWDSDKLLHIPTFVKTETISCTARKNKILYIGRLDKTKGVDVLLKALEYINTNYPNINFECTIAGNGENNYVTQLKNFVDKNKLNNIKFLGHVDKATIDLMIKDSLTVVTPSIWYDNLPNAILESFAVGTPVIASNIGSLPELVVDGQTGLLFEVGSPKDLAEKILYLLKQPKLIDEMGMNAYNYVLKNHNPETHYEKLMEIYYRLT